MFKLIFTPLLLIVSYCYATPELVVMHYRGTVVIPPCTIATPLASVNFGNILASELTNSSDSTDWKELNINLSDCTDVGKYTVTVSAPVSTANAKYIGSTGTAEHIAIEAVAALDSDIQIYNKSVLKINTGGEASQILPLKFRLHNDGSGEATTGTVTSTITLTYAFQ
ncbi:fimbrial protein [Obesumbacterium proteus]|uniref:fimbrial protein n=1 Tax=Obesumbacterium proteus TaxID=82983 RepID=UPI00242EC5BA|nr:fimbrial protein [Obesumbacterium proteus]